MGKWRQDLEQARPWLLLQFAPLVLVFSILSHVMFPAPYGVLMALAWLALLAACVVVTLRRRKSSR